MSTRAAPLSGLPLLEDLGEIGGKRVLLRADLNVPLDDHDGEMVIADEFRIRAALPTVEWLTDRGAEVVCCSHLGRPSGAPDRRYSLAPVASRMAELAPGVSVMENLRFDPGETENDAAFVRRLIDGFDAYVNDAFGACHRSHASIVGPPLYLPSAAGRLLELEVATLGALLNDPPRPFVAIVGGAKVADKLGVLRALAKVADTIIVGGGMAFTFLAAQGRSVGSSLCDEAKIDECREILHGPATILLPSDIVALEAGCSFGHGCQDGEVRIVDGDLPDGWTGLDIGPVSAQTFSETVRAAGTVLWNGPMGAFEDRRFEAGTRSVAQAVAETAAMSIVGGGDSARAIDDFGLAEKIDFLSTGGGASLEFLEHGDLPALAALRAAPNAPRI